jgi:hypothetical protein
VAVGWAGAVVGLVFSVGAGVISDKVGTWVETSGGRMGSVAVVSAAPQAARKKTEAIRSSIFMD